MTKQTTKQELVNKINEKFYTIEQPILYNTFLENGAGEMCRETHLSMTGEEPSRELMKEFFTEKFLPHLKDIDKAEMLGNTIDYLKSQMVFSESLLQAEKQYRMLQKLIKGCDTMEKLNKLKELPIMKEYDCNKCDGGGTDFCDC